MRKLKRLAIFMVVVQIILAVTACSAQQTAAPAEVKKIKMGVSLGNCTDVFDRILYEGMMQYSEEHKSEIETILLDAKADVNIQLSNVDQLINSKVDVIVLWPYEKEPLTPAVEKANAANIPVVCVNTLTSGGEFVYVGSNDVDAGKIQGEWLAKNLPQNASFGYIMGAMGHSGQIGRKEGLEATLMKTRTDVKMLAEQSSQWTREKALSISEDWLKSYQDITALVCQNDNSALGAIEAARTAGKLDDLIIVGVDATEEACQKIKEGEMEMSVFQNASLQGYKSMDVAMQIAQKKWTGGNEYIIPFEAVDKSNVDEYLEKYKK